MRKIVILFLLLSVNFIYGQSITNVRFEQDGKKINVFYDLTGVSYRQEVKISLFISSDGGATFKGPLKSVTGDIGDKIEAGINKKIVWDVYKDVADVSGNIVFNVKAEVEKQKVKKQVFVQYTGSLAAPIGVKAGIMNGFGYYGAIRLNTNAFRKASFTTNDTEIPGYDLNNSYYLYNGKAVKPRLSITAGVSIQILKRFYLYAGVGYGYRYLLWNIYQYDIEGVQTGSAWAKHPDYSCNGLELEGGLTFKVWKILLEAGITNVAFKRTDITVGAGFIF